MPVHERSRALYQHTLCGAARGKMSLLPKVSEATEAREMRAPQRSSLFFATIELFSRKKENSLKN